MMDDWTPADAYNRLRNFLSDKYGDCPERQVLVRWAKREGRTFDSVMLVKAMLKERERKIDRLLAKLAEKDAEIARCHKIEDAARAWDALDSDYDREYPPKVVTDLCDLLRNNPRPGDT